MTEVELPRIETTRDLVRHLQETSPGFSGLIERFGEAAQAFRHVGLVQWQAGRVDVAIDAFLAALSLHPGDADVWRDLASVYSAGDQFQLARSAISTSIGLNGDQAQSWLVLAGLLDRRDDTQQAESAYRRAIALAPALAAAHFGLGLLLFRRKDFPQARIAIASAVEQEPSNGFAQACLGHVLYIDGDFEGCAQAFAMAARSGDLDAEGRRKWTRAVTFQAMIEGRIDEALRDYPDLAGQDCEALETISRDAFSVLTAAGHLDAAAALGRIRLRQAPNDPIRRYLLDAVTGQSITAAPSDYIETHFDDFAPQFDQKLVEVLHYVAPKLIVEAIARHRTQFRCMLDAGCGTGLAADMLSEFGTMLTGVDLSSRMLDEARKRERYTELVKSEIVAFLARNPARFDLIFAADLLIYFGELFPFFEAAAGALVPGGILALSTESESRADYALLPSGRFRHASAYIERMIAADFIILKSFEHDIRLEAGRPVPGFYVVAERR